MYQVSKLREEESIELLEEIGSTLYTMPLITECGTSCMYVIPRITN